MKKIKDINSYKNTSYDYRLEISNLKNEIQELNKEKEKVAEEKNNIELFYQNELNNILSSKSWKLTAPIRKIKKWCTHNSNNQINLSSINNKLAVPPKIVPTHSYKEFKAYTSEYEDNIDYSNFDTDIKTLAFYLPQFHTFKENDEWWGKGFTEWTNTKKAKPYFKGHYQPRIPHDDFGYYSLDNVDTIKKQVLLAKTHGLYGFCFYYYWFSGKRLMEKPVDLFLNDKSIDFPFCFCWANENWTRTWDGLQNDILIKQQYTPNDPKKFIKDLKKYFSDSRYIRIDGKPLLLIYNPKEIPDFKGTVHLWRKYAREEKIGELFILSKCDFADSRYQFCEYVDGEFDFPPHGVGHPATQITGLSSKKVFNYEKIVDDIEVLYHNHFPLKPFYYTCTMGWDNSARRKEGYTIYYNYSLKSFYKWLKIIIRETRRRNPPDKRFIFINAWNEWAEGTYLEPDQKYGYANINTLSKAIYDLPLKQSNSKKDK